MEKTSRLIFLALGCLLVGGLILLAWLNRTTQVSVEIGGREVTVEVVDTIMTRARGLSGRESLPPDHGMLFVFEYEGMHGFWMKDMLFSIDIVGLDTEGKVVWIENDLSPDTFPNAYAPSVPVQFVLELPDDAVERYGIERGQVIPVFALVSDE